jgi:hypothetical protein
MLPLEDGEDQVASGYGMLYLIATLWKSACQEDSSVSPSGDQLGWVGASLGPPAIALSFVKPLHRSGRRVKKPSFRTLLHRGQNV